jgi:hypothetical protein
VIEVVFVLGLAATCGGVVSLDGLRSLDENRGVGAARYVAGRLQQARMEAVGRNAATALRFSSSPGGYSYTTYVDGNGNGVLSRDILSGVDVVSRSAESLRDQFPGVEFGVLPALPPVDPSSAAPGTNPIRLGTSNGVTFTPLGTSSPGSVYLLTRGGVQFAVRIFAETGKTRVLRFQPATGQWTPIGGA